MRTLTGLCLFGLIVSSAVADPMNLAGGALITHYVPDIPLTDPEDACELYADYAITHHSQQVNRIDTPGGTPDTQPATWFIIAAGTERRQCLGGSRWVVGRKLRSGLLLLWLCLRCPGF